MSGNRPTRRRAFLGKSAASLGLAAANWMAGPGRVITSRIIAAVTSLNLVSVSQYSDSLFHRAFPPSSQGVVQIAVRAAFHLI